jgi:hypothetical protein
MKDGHQPLARRAALRVRCLTRLTCEYLVSGVLQQTFTPSKEYVILAWVYDGRFFGAFYCSRFAVQFSLSEAAALTHPSDP